MLLTSFHATDLFSAPPACVLFAACRAPSCSTATCRCTSRATTPTPSSSRACTQSRCALHVYYPAELCMGSQICSLRAKCGWLVCVGMAKSAARQTPANVLCPCLFQLGTDHAVVLQLFPFICSATWWTPTNARWHTMTMRRSMRWVGVGWCLLGPALRRSYWVLLPDALWYAATQRLR